MNRETRFINYLEGLKTTNNTKLLESITDGFKTLVEYRVGGTPAEKMVDIMESEDDVDSDVEAVDADGETSDVSTLEETVDVEPFLEVGEGEVKGQLNPAILRAVDAAVEERIRKMSDMIDRQKLVSNDDQKIKYLNSMRGQLWRDSLIDKGIDPAKAKGLIPAMNESIEDANVKLLDFVDSAFKIFSIDKSD